MRGRDLLTQSLTGRKKDKKEKDTPEKKRGATVRGSGADDTKSPRPESGGSDEGAAAEVATEEVLVFSLADQRLALTHRKLLNDTVFYDMELFLGGAHKKNPPQRAHRAVLQVRCPALLQEGKFISKIEKGKHNRFEARISEQHLPCMSPVVLNQLMIYVYSGTMEVSRFSLSTLLDMCATAVALGLQEIVWLCEHKVRELLTVESVHSILKGAEDRSLAGTKNFALEFAFAEWGSFIGNTEGAKILGLELFQDVSAKYAKGEKVAYPEGPQPENTVVHDYRRLYEEMPVPDLQIEVASEKLPCHRAILAMYSDALGHHFGKLKNPGLQSTKLVEHDDKFLELQSSAAVVSMLRFVYYGETKMDPLDACEMIHKVNSVYKLSTFQLLCEHTIANNIDSRSVIPILGVTYIPGFSGKPHIQSLRKHALDYIIANFGITDLSSLSQMPAEIRTDLLMTLQQAFQAGKLGQPMAPGAAPSQPPAAAVAVEAPRPAAGGGNEEEVAVAVEDDDSA